MSEKKQAKTIIFATFISVAALFFSSCLNLFEETSLTDISGSAVGHISIENNAPVEIDNSLSRMINRTAFPSIPTGSTISYYAEVTDTATTTPVTWNGSADFTGFPNYTITGLDIGVKWKIEIGIKDGTNKILKDTHTMTSALTAEEPVYSHDFELKPNQTAAVGSTPAGKGSIDLEIELESSSEITKCITSLSASDFTPSSNKITVSISDVDSGNHSVDFTFYSSTSEIIYQFTESVNVFDNMTTNTWVRNGGTEGSPYLVEETTAGVTVTKCKISNAMVSAFRQTTFYVKVDGNVNGTGTYFNPLQSIQGAITKMHDKDLDYRIYLRGAFNGSVISISFDFKNDTSGTYQAKSLTICGYDGFDDNGEPNNVIAGLGKGSQNVIISYSNVPLIFKNVKITNGTCGILINNSQESVTLDDGVYITGNTTAVSGRSFTMKGSAYIKSDNPVSLETALSDVTYKINIAGPLTKHSSEDKIKVIPTSYKRGTVIVEADGTNVTDLTSMKDYFEVADTDWYTCLSADKSKIAINAPYFVAPDTGDVPDGFGNGDDTNGNGSSATPYATIYRVTKDIHSNNIALDYTIKVVGKIIGPQQIIRSGDTNCSDYSADHVVSTDNAASITVMGARNLPDNGHPLDTICVSEYGDSYPALYYSADGVPLTIKNICLTKGCTGLSVISSGPVYIENGTEIKGNTKSHRLGNEYLYAKGIYMEGGTLYMNGGEIHDNTIFEGYPDTNSDYVAGGIHKKDGFLYMSGGKIYNNYGINGGGIYINSADVYIYGSAVIGNENATSCAIDENNCSNKTYTNGGGIYITDDSHVEKHAKLYLGYKPGEDGNPVVDEEFTGGIYYNFASYSGGGIYNYGKTDDSSESEVHIAKGTIAYNTGDKGSGGIFCNGSKTKLEISGGVIKENKVNRNTGHGGAINATTLTLSGSVSIPAGVTDATTHNLVTGRNLNDVYIPNHKIITIAGKLEPPEGSGGITATLTPDGYPEGRVIVALRTSPAPNPTTTIEEASACFTVTTEVDTSVTPNVISPWYITSTGTLTDSLPVSSLTSAPSSGTRVAVSDLTDLTTVNNWVKDSSDGLTGVIVKLGSNISLDSSFNKQIGTSTKPFKGTFDGNEKTVTYTNSNYSIIGYTSTGAVIKNLNLEGTVNTASLASEITGTTVENCTSSCTVKKRSTQSGGLINKAYSTDASDTTEVMDCIIKDCIFTGTLDAENSEASYVGGIVGDSKLCIIQNCEMSGNVTGGFSVGGIVGFVGYRGANGYGSYIENCCVTGNVSAVNSTRGSCGGIVGGATTGTSKTFNCCFTGTLSSPVGLTGGITTYSISTSCDNCYFTGDNTLGWNCENTNLNEQTNRVSTITSTEIASLNEHNLTSTYASVASPSVYRQWTLDSSGKPKLVR